MSFDTGWSWTDWGHERRQNQNLEYLHDQLAIARGAAARTERALKQRLHALSGDLGARITALGRALDATLELSDLRFELQVFQGAALARASVRRFLVRATDSHGIPALDVADVPGYWLVPAARALAGEDTVDEARERDPRRTALFLAAALPILGGDGVPHLAAALGGDGPVTRVQWELWRAAGSGALGPEGVTVAGAWMRERLTGDGEAWHAAAAGLAGGGVLTGPARAAHRLGLLRDVVTGVGETTPDSSALFALVQDLVDEGSPEETPLLRRAAGLRAQITARAAEPIEVPPADEPVGEPEDLLAAALGAEDALSRGLAVRFGGTRVREAADALLAASKVEVATEKKVSRLGATLRVTEAGADPGERAAAVARIRERNPGPRTIGWIIGLAVSVAAAIGCALSPAPGTAVLPALAALVTAIGWVRTVREAARADTIGFLTSSLDRDIERAAEELSAARVSAEKAAADAESAHRDLLAALA